MTRAAEQSPVRAQPARTKWKGTQSARVRWLVPTLVALITIAAFIPALSAGFVTWDDDRNFTNNLHWRGLGLSQFKWMWSTFHMGHYVPLSWMTLGLDYAIWGMNPVGYHLTNLLLHAVNAVLVYFVARQLLRLAAPSAATDDARVSWAAGFAALVFAVHPLRVESVAWITERRDVLSGCFYTLTVACYLRAVGTGANGGTDADTHGYAATDSAPGRGWYWMSVIAFVFGMLAKASVMTVPAVLLALNVYPLRRLPAHGGWRHRLGGADARRVYMQVLPFVAIAVAMAGLSIVALKPPDQLPAGGKVAVSAYSLAFYFAKSLLPLDLSPLYEMPQQVDPFATPFLLAYATVAIGVVGTWFVRKQWPAFAAAMVVFVVVLLPTIGIVQNGPQLAADRYTYHAAPALAMLAGAGFLLAVARWPAATKLSGAGLVFTLGAASWQQSKVWHDSETLWTRALAVDSTSSIAQVGLANEFARQGRLPDAIERYNRGLAINPAYAEGHNNLGIALVRVGRLDEALPHHERAAALKPDYSEAYSNWGIALARHGSLPLAIENYQRALKLDPENVDAQVNWGNALVRMDSLTEAVPHYEAALAVRPDDAEAHLNWGVSLARAKNFDEAIVHFTAALSIQPNLTEAKAYLDRAMQLRESQPRQP